MKTIKKTVVNPATLASDIVKASSKVPTVKKEAVKPSHTVYAPILSTPAGHALFSYTDAIMSVLGMNSIKRNSVPEKAFKAFQGMTKALSYHGKLGRIEKTGNGLVRLTTQGLTFFTQRKEKHNLDQKVIDKMISAMKSGKYSKAKTAVFQNVKYSKVTY